MGAPIEQHARVQLARIDLVTFAADIHKRSHAALGAERGHVRVVRGIHNAKRNLPGHGGLQCVQERGDRRLHAAPLGRLLVFRREKHHGEQGLVLGSDLVDKFFIEAQPRTGTQVHSKRTR